MPIGMPQKSLITVQRRELPADGGDRLGAVRRPGRVAEIYDPFLGQLLPQIRDRSQPAQAGIKKTDRSVIHKKMNPFR